MFKHGMVTVDGLECTADVHTNKPLVDLTTRGGKWIELSPDTPDDVAIEISVWYNLTNDSNQVTHEIAHIVGIEKVCIKESETAKVVVLSTVVAKAMHELGPKTQSTSVMLHLARYVSVSGLEGEVKRLVDFHSAEVNPNELTVAATTFGEVAQQLPKDAKTFKTDLMMLAYNAQGCIQKVRPQPDIADFIQVKDIKSLGGRQAEVMLVNGRLQKLYLNEQLQLDSFMPNSKARSILRTCSFQILRLMLNKGALPDFNPVAKAGIMDKEKVDTIILQWKLWVQKSFNPSSLWEFVSAPAVAAEVVSEERAFIGPECQEELALKGYIVGATVVLQKRVTGVYGATED